MSSRFQVDPTEKIAIAEFEPGSRGDEQPNVIYIRARMDVGHANRVMSMAAVRDSNGKPNIDEQGAAYLTAQMIVNIVAWEGPDFDDLPCTPETIRKLPGADEFILRVQGEIAERNRGRSSPDPKKVTANGSHNNGSSDSIVIPFGRGHSANTTSISNSPSATNGRRKK